MKAVVTSLRVIVIMTVLTGVIYPLLITGISQTLFSHKANGSMVSVHGNVVGSELIGQAFATDRYFWSRPSAVGYNPMPSGGSNLGPTSKALRDSIYARAARSGLSVRDLPPDILTASGSGLDPDISPETALLQVNRVAEARNWGTDGRTRLAGLVRAHIKHLQFRVLGEPRVNVLELNLALDSLTP